MKSRTGAVVAAWLLAAVYYFYQYVMRSSTAVMMPQLAATFGLSAAGAASLAALFYYGYAPFSLVAGTALDRLGAKLVIPAGALMAGAGALLFGTGNLAAAQLGRFLQGAGGVFALLGAIYIVSRNFPAARAATMIGATQTFGSAGGSAGQFVVGPMIVGGLSVRSFWIGMGAIGFVVAVALFFLLPAQERNPKDREWFKSAVRALRVVASNPQSILCGVIAGLLFIPTTVFDMIWGVRFLQEGHGFDYGEAVIRSSTVPLGWIVGAPLMGAISDRIGRRKPVIICAGALLLACLAFILYGHPGLLPPYLLGFITGVASGSGMLTYTMIKETNPPQFAGTATGVISLLNFGITAMVAPVFGSIMQNASQGVEIGLRHYQMTFQPLLYGVGLAILLTLALKETGPATHLPAITAEAA